MNEILNLKSKVNLYCSICDKCCEYRGDIKITPINVLQISKFLKISIKEFLENYTEEVKGQEPERVIKAVGEKQRCIFNDSDFKCKIQKVKPMQCVVFPLVPVDVGRNLFINTNQCEVDTKKTTTVNKWINGNNKIYNRNKDIYLEWIKLIEEIQIKWNQITEADKNNIKKLLFEKYDMKKNFEKQITENIKHVRKIIYIIN